MQFSSLRRITKGDAIPMTLYQPPSGQSHRHHTDPKSIESTNARRNSSANVRLAKPEMILISATHMYWYWRKPTASSSETSIRKRRSSAEIR